MLFSHKNLCAQFVKQETKGPRSHSHQGEAAEPSSLQVTLPLTNLCERKPPSSNSTPLTGQTLKRFLSARGVST